MCSRFCCKHIDEHKSNKFTTKIINIYKYAYMLTNTNVEKLQLTKLDCRSKTTYYFR